MRVLFGALFLLLSLSSRVDAAVCQGGVLYDAAGRTPTGTCTLTTGEGIDVTCTNGKLTTSNGADAGSCSGAQQPSGDLLRDGVFGCSSSKYSNVGSLSAIGGVYVPVNDAAVTLNTGYLVYKECVLDGVIAKISEAARTDLTQTTLRKINEGRDGQPLWMRNRWDEIDRLNLRTTKITASDEFISTMCPAYSRDVRTQSVRRFLANRRAPNNAFACGYSGSAEEMRAAFEGHSPEGKVLQDIGELAFNNQLSDSIIYEETSNAIRAAAIYDFEERLRMGRGFIDITDGDENPFAEKILTPAYLVSEGAQQVYTSGFRCLEGADELSEVCAPLFTAMVPESFNNGLYSMTKSQSGLPSFVSRMVSEAAAAVRTEAVNAALSILLTTRQFEYAFKQARDTAATVLTNAINQLRTTEKNCWDLIINNPSGPRVCASPPDSNRRCTSPETCTTNPDGSQQCTPGVQLVVATSSRFNFAQPIIDTQIAPVARRVATDITASAAALQELDNLIGDVTNAASAANQRAALSRLDQLVAPNTRLPDCSPDKTLHSAGDVQCANKERDDIGTAVGSLVESTVRDWGDSQDPNVGWCNVNNPAVIQRWINAWKI